MEQFFNDHFTEFVIGAMLVGAFIMIWIAVNTGD